jgi:hypothetical protein
MADFRRKTIGCIFDGWSRAGTRERQRLGALMRCRRERNQRRSRNAQTADKTASGIGYRHG